MRPNVCYEPSILYKPEGAYSPIAGYRAESFLVPFSFTVLANGQLQANYPWKLDDDVPWGFRGLVFAEIGTAEAVNAGGVGVSGLTGTPMLVRIWDTHGNSLTNANQNSNPQNQKNDLVLAMGVAGQSGFDSINAFGFPFGCEVLCEPGGTILFDFQIPSNSPPASLTINATTGSMIVTAPVLGVAGNAYTLTITDLGVPNTPLSVAVVGKAVTVTLQDNAGGVAISTYAQVAAAINASAAASALMTAVSEDTVDTATSFSTTALSGGGPSTPVVVQGTMIGCKLFKDC